MTTVEDTPLTDYAIEEEDDLTPRRRLVRGPVRQEKAKKERKSAPPYRQGAITKQMYQFYGVVGMGVTMVDQHCGMAIIENAEMMAQSWEGLAKQSPALRKVLALLSGSGGVFAVAMAHAPLALAIGAHHGPEEQREKLTMMMMGLNAMMQQAAEAQEAEAA